MKNIYFNVEKTFDLSENFNISNQTTCLFGTTSGSPVYLEQLVAHLSICAHLGFIQISSLGGENNLLFVFP